MADTGLDRLASLAGIEPWFTDAWGGRREPDAATKRALLSAKGLAVCSDGEIAEAIRVREETPWRRPLAPVHVSQWRRKRGPTLALHLPNKRMPGSIDWIVELESGETRKGTLCPNELSIVDRRTIDGQPMGRRLFELPFAPPQGYHRFRLSIADDGREDARLSLIVAPKRGHLPLRLSGGKGIWGFAIQLYALQSKRSWGMGDFGDLRRFAQIAEELGAETVGLNPLHALFPSNPAHASPYSPSSRRFLNILYIEVEAVPDFGESPAAQELVSSNAFRAQLERLRGADLVDYTDVAHAKRRVFELIYGSFRRNHLGDEDGSANTGRGRAFREFQRLSGRYLELYGLFEALSEHFDTHDWKGWPEPYRHADTREVAEFARSHRHRIELFHYLEWEAERQLQSAAKEVARLGMAPGLYQDLALGVDANGMEAWARQDLLVNRASLGAPPDDWNLNGQNWGSPPVDPDELREHAYLPFVEMLRANMRYGGALRIDHVMSLMRLYWIPEGAEPGDGAYVRYPFEDLLNILALESRRERCVIIGEDLGTVPEGFQERTQRAHVLSYRLLYFERNKKGEFKSPEEYPRLAASAVGTHDLPTLPGFWMGRDLAVRSELGLFPSNEAQDAAFTGRTVERESLVVALKRAGLLPDDFTVEDGAPDPRLIEAVHRYLGKTPSMISMVQLEDVLGEVNQVNVPGTTAQYPNWRRKILTEVDDLAEDPRISRLASALREVRPSGRRSRSP